jgi:hypothetical protein
MDKHSSEYGYDNELIHRLDEALELIQNHYQYFYAWLAEHETEIENLKRRSDYVYLENYYESECDDT